MFAAVLASYYDPNPGVAALPREEVVAQARLTVPLLMGGLQGLMSWWLEHPEVPRAKVEARAVDVGWLGLDRIRAVLAALGDPQRAFRVIHVAGTNGKGSTCAMIAAGLRARPGDSTER